MHEMILERKRRNEVKYEKIKYGVSKRYITYVIGDCIIDSEKN